MSTFLAPAELQELTGYRYSSRQIRWLKREGWTFAVDALGQPKVLRAHMESKMGAPKPSRRQHATEPDFAALSEL